MNNSGPNFITDRQITQNDTVKRKEIDEQQH